MPSQIKVDEIKNVAGQYEIKTDTFKGQTTAGSISVQGEGTATTNLQQGIAKAWSLTADDASIDDSLNFSSGTDNGTGDYTTTFSTNMSNTTYAVPATMAQDASVFTINKARATSSVRMFNVRHDNVSSDKKQCYAVFGDLA
jgi:hypothetical protein|tara:strand:- start:347 stop:772 length:426 start_codon:yes stop_codon:yes gene_type:complete